MARTHYVIQEPDRPHQRREKRDYIHRNPVKRGYVDIPEHWRYSSARNCLGEPGLIGVAPWS